MSVGITDDSIHRLIYRKGGKITILTPYPPSQNASDFPKCQNSILLTWFSRTELALLSLTWPSYQTLFTHWWAAFVRLALVLRARFFLFVFCISPKDPVIILWNWGRREKMKRTWTEEWKRGVVQTWDLQWPAPTRCKITAKKKRRVNCRFRRTEHRSMCSQHSSSWKCSDFALSLYPFSLSGIPHTATHYPLPPVSHRHTG